ncbi:MAG: hypothetical protein ACREK1_01160 [Longimicrobiales bacterium]
MTTKARAVLGALSLLVLGGVLGIAIDRHFLSSDRHSLARDRHSPAAAFHDMAMSSLADRLDLDADQRRQIDSILGERHHTLRQTWQTLHAQLGAAVDTVHRDIEAVLTPGQRTAFREWLRDVDAGR